jgi:hypothetical protein
MCGGTGFAVFSKRRKERNDPGNQPFYDPRVNGTVGFAEKTRANGQQRSVKRQNRGSRGRGKGAEKRK